MFDRIINWFLPGKVIVVRLGEEYVIGRKRRPGEMRIHVDRIEIDADWMRSRTVKRTQPDGRILLQQRTRF